MNIVEHKNVENDLMMDVPGCEIVDNIQVVNNPKVEVTEENQPPSVPKVESVKELLVLRDLEIDVKIVDDSQYKKSNGW